MITTKTIHCGCSGFRFYSPFVRLFVVHKTKETNEDQLPYSLCAFKLMRNEVNTAAVLWHTRYVVMRQNYSHNKTRQLSAHLQCTAFFVPFILTLCVFCTHINSKQKPENCRRRRRREWEKRKSIYGVPSFRQMARRANRFDTDCVWQREWLAMTLFIIIHWRLVDRMNGGPRDVHCVLSH